MTVPTNACSSQSNGLITSMGNAVLCVAAMAAVSPLTMPALGYPDDSTIHTRKEAIKVKDVTISSFVSENKTYQIDPPIRFEHSFNSETQMVEIIGEIPYQSILVYGKTINEAKDILQTEIIPLMWEKYVNGDGIKLSANAQKIKNDLGNRVAR